MKKFSTLLSFVVIMMLLSTWNGTVWAQDALQVTADATRVTQDFDGMWNGQEATLDMPQGWRVEHQ